MATAEEKRISGPMLSSAVPCTLRCSWVARYLYLPGTGDRGGKMCCSKNRLAFNKLCGTYLEHMLMHPKTWFIRRVERIRGKCAGLAPAQRVVTAEAGFFSWGELCAADDIMLRLAIVMVQHPSLNSRGMRLGEGVSIQDKARVLFEERNALRKDIETVEWVAHWLLDNIEPTKDINRNRTSYEWKHVVERDSDPHRYVSNGVFIAAALITEYPMVILAGSADGVFGMSEKSFKIVDKRRKHKQVKPREKIPKRIPKDIKDID